MKSPDHVRIERRGKSFTVVSVIKGVSNKIKSCRTVDSAFDAAYAFMDSIGHDLPIDRVSVSD